MNKLEIVNFALNELAVDEIATYDSLTAQGRTVRAKYPHLKEKALEGFDWPFARVESAALAKVADSEEGNEQYQLPNGVEMLTRVHNQNGYELAFRKMGNIIELIESNLGENNTLHIQYIKLVDEGKFPAYFGVALAMDLAASTCMSFTENATMRDSLKAEAKDLYSKARRLARQVGGNQKLAPQSEYSMLHRRRG